MNDASPTVSEMITVEYTEYVAVVTMLHRPYNLSGPWLRKHAGLSHRLWRVQRPDPALSS